MFVQNRLMILLVAVFLQAFVFSTSAGASIDPPSVSDQKPLEEEDNSLSLLKAAEAGNITLFDQEMEKLLFSPFSHWAEALFAEDISGQNLFHKIAKVTRNQRAFAKRMIKIINLISPSSPEVTSVLWSRRDDNLSGVNLFQQGAEDHFIINRTMEDSRRELREKLREIFQNHSTTSVLSSLHNMTGSGEVPSISLFNDGAEEEQTEVSVRVRFKGPLPPYLAKDHQGLSPIALADREGNAPVYNELKKTAAFRPYNSEKAQKDFLIWAVIGAGMGGFGAPHLMEFLQVLSFQPDPSAEEWIVRGYAAAVVGLITGMVGTYSSKCYRAFRRRIKTRPESPLPPSV